MFYRNRTVLSLHRNIANFGCEHGIQVIFEFYGVFVGFYGL